MCHTAKFGFEPVPINSGPASLILTLFTIRFMYFHVAESNISVYCGKITPHCAPLSLCHDQSLCQSSAEHVSLWLLLSHRQVTWRHKKGGGGGAKCKWSRVCTKMSVLWWNRGKLAAVEEVLKVRYRSHQASIDLPIALTLVSVFGSIHPHLLLQALNFKAKMKWWNPTFLLKNSNTFTLSAAVFGPDVL